MRQRRLVFLGDSLTRYEYEALAHLILETKFPENMPHPMSLSLFTSKSGQKELAKYWTDPNISKDCHSYPQQSKWGPTMRYNHDFLRLHEVCDCSPGGTECCDQRFENRVVHLANNSFLAYFQFLGGLYGGFKGSLDLQSVHNFAVNGIHPNDTTFPCPAGVARPHTWAMPFPEFLQQLIPFKPTHVIFNTLNWIRTHNNPYKKSTFVSYAVAGQKFSALVGAQMYWRVDPVLHHQPDWMKEAVSIFETHGWILLNAAYILQNSNLTTRRHRETLFADDKHLTIPANNFIVNTFMDQHVCAV
jgi:hypothetical protein